VPSKSLLGNGKRGPRTLFKGGSVRKKRKTKGKRKRVKRSVEPDKKVGTSLRAKGSGSRATGLVREGAGVGKP